MPKKTQDPLPQQETKTYPHVTFYDFEAYQDKTQKNAPTDFLTYENAHVPISVSLGDTLEREPTHICDANPKELIRKFMEELERRGKISGTRSVPSTCLKIATCSRRRGVEPW